LVLPTLFHLRFEIPLRLICLDFSPAALDSLRNLTFRKNCGVTAGEVYEEENIVFKSELDCVSTQFNGNDCLLSPNPNSIEFLCGDLKHLDFPDSSVDLILDKGATDAVLRRGSAGVGGVAEFERCFAEMDRVLRRDQIGKILHVSDEDPDVRLQFLLDRLNRIGENNNGNDDNDNNVDNKVYPKIRRNAGADSVENNHPTFPPYSVTFEALELGVREVFFYSIY